MNKTFKVWAFYLLTLVASLAGSSSVYAQYGDCGKTCGYHLLNSGQRPTDSCAVYCYWSDCSTGSWCGCGSYCATGNYYDHCVLGGWCPCTYCN